MPIQTDANGKWKTEEVTVTTPAVAASKKTVWATVNNECTTKEVDVDAVPESKVTTT
jgi:hypothetical protein